MGKTVIFSTGAKGGVGKSTMAIVMIEALREAGVRVSGIEGDEHSPSLHRKYDGTIDIADIDLAALFGEEGVELFNEAVNSLPDGYIVVNTPASGSRMFDEIPGILRSAAWETRATWCLAIKPDRSCDGVNEDGLFESLERGMLSGVSNGGVTVVRPLFQEAYRGQKFWYDSYQEMAKQIGLREMTMKKLPSKIFDAVSRDRRSIPELIADFSNIDPLTGANMALIWYGLKKSLAETVLVGEPILVGDVVSKINSIRIYGEGGITEAMRGNGIAPVHDSQGTDSQGIDAVVKGGGKK